MITYLLAYLAADTSLAALVETRLRANMLDQNMAYPAVVYTLISRVAPHHRSGPDSFVQTRWQFDVHARTYSEVVAVTEALIARAQTFTRADAPRCDRVFVESMRDLASGEFDEVTYYRRSVDFMILHNEV